MTTAGYVLTAIAAVAAGLVNALAGGGTLLLFPAMLAGGLGAVSANVTSTIAVLPGYFASVTGLRAQLGGQSSRVRAMAPLVAVGTVVGAGLLIAVSEAVFGAVVPWLVLAAALLLAVGPRVQGLARARAGDHAAPGSVPRTPALAGVGLAAVYGGFFGAGLGIVVLAVLSLTVHDTFVRLNALKGLLQFVVGTTAALLFAVAGPVCWPAAAVAAGGSFAGGRLGAALSLKLPPGPLRALVVVLGLVAGVVLLVQR